MLSPLPLKNLDFFASNVEAVGLKKNEDEIDEINLDSINFFYPSSSKRMLQDNAVPQRTKLVAKMHGSISVVNCTFFGAEGSALYYWSKKSKIQSVYILTSLIQFIILSRLEMVSRLRVSVTTILGEIEIAPQA